jgi:polyhydroxyalkanoate synthesis regulator phasin
MKKKSKRPKRVVSEILNGMEEIEKHQRGEIELQDGKDYLEDLGKKIKVLKIDAKALKELSITEFSENPEQFQYSNMPKQKMLFKAFKEGRISIEEYKIFGGVIK